MPLSSGALGRRLDVILEDETTSVADDPYRAAIGVADDIRATRERLRQLEESLGHARDRLCGGLAMAVRKLQPSLSVSLSDGGCRISYNKKDLSFRPDLDRKVWVVESNRQRFGSRFRRSYGHATHLIPDLNPLAEAVADFFGTFYRSIGEGLEGGGSTVVAGRLVTLAELAGLVMRKDKLLREARIEKW